MPTGRCAPVLVLLAWPTLAGADTITLTNGRVIQADRAWFEGGQIRYEKNGGSFGLPRDLVRRLERAPASGLLDPDVQRAREVLASDPAAAAALLRGVVERNPSSVTALLLAAVAHLRLADTRAATALAERALALEPEDAEARSVLGDILAYRGLRKQAEEQYRESLARARDPQVEAKLAALSGSLRPPPLPTFRLRYQGGPPRDSLTASVQAALQGAAEDYRRRLGFAPDGAIDVVLSLDTAPGPDWAAGVNDGSIHLAVEAGGPTVRLMQVARHELAHSFLTYRTGGNCPTWLQEGVAQWLEGGDAAREDPGAAVALRAGRLRPLVLLEAPFQGLGQAEATLAYVQSLSAVNHVLRLRGEAGLGRLLAALGDRLPSEEALPVALGLSYAEFQRSWQEHLGTLR
jgi:tetratricopeptide (TPR) repeat protein